MPTWLWWWLGFCIVAGCLFTAVTVSIARARQKNHVQIRETGVVLDPVVPTGASHSLRRVGAGVLSGRFGKVSARWPLVVLELRGGELSMRIRPAALGAAFGARPLHASVGNGAVVFPARGWFRSRYVGIEVNREEGYFRSSRPEEMLGVLQAAGFNVTRTERKLTYL